MRRGRLPGEGEWAVFCGSSDPRSLALTRVPFSQLDNVRDRVDEIESLHRTSELTVKDDNDLGGFLRLRIGNLTKEHEKKKDEGGDDDDAVGEKMEKLREPRREI